MKKETREEIVNEILLELALVINDDSVIYRDIETGRKRNLYQWVKLRLDQLK